MLFGVKEFLSNLKVESGWSVASSQVWPEVSRGMRGTN